MRRSTCSRTSRLSCPTTSSSASAPCSTRSSSERERLYECRRTWPHTRLAPLLFICVKVATRALGTRPRSPGDIVQRPVRTGRPVRTRSGRRRRRRCKPADTSLRVHWGGARDKDEKIAGGSEFSFLFISISCAAVVALGCDVR